MPSNSTEPQLARSLALALFAIMVFAATTGSILMKLGADRLHLQPEPLLFLQENFLIFLGLATYSVPLILTIYLYRYFTVGTVQAVAAGVYVTSPLVAFTIGLESFSLLKVLGIAIVFGAIVNVLLGKLK